MRITFALAVLTAFFALNLFADNPAPPATKPSAPAPSPATNAAPAPVPPSAPSAPSLYNFTVNSLDGKPVDLGQYRGKVALVVNTATHGGYTQQFAGLEKLYEDYKDKGFVILAFPSNDFGGQEPGTPQEIATLCSTTYHIAFPLFEKTKTRGDGQSPVYQFLTKGHGVPQWNFHKYLVDKSGNVIREFHSQDRPDNKDLTDAIDAALKG